MTAPAIAINGRFHHLEPGGYQRYATEVSSRLDEATVVQPSPRNARGIRGRTWEQWVLAQRTQKQVLFSPAGSGPLTHPRHVVVLHDLLPLDRPEWFSRRAAQLQRRFLPQLLNRAQRVIVPSADVAARVAQRLPPVASRTTVIAPAVGAPFDRRPHPARVGAMAQRLQLGRGQPLVGGLIAASTRKNSQQLLRVLAEVGRRTGARVAVAGHVDGPRVVAGDERPRDGNVIDLGPIKDHELAAFYHLMTVFVSLSLGEGYGMPIVEAAACGASIVTTPVPAATELLEQHCTIVDPLDTGGVVDAVEQALHDRDPSTTLARQATARRWTWPDASARINNLLKELSS
ncbi:MAG: glycosyltransferase [Acidimicrobiales bacterium]